MKFSIPYLVAKPTAGGTRYYWEPSPALRKANWTRLALGLEPEAAIVAAKERNKAVQAWRNGGVAPQKVEKFVQASTLGALIKRYRAGHLVTLAANTQSTDSAALNRLDTWAGDQPISFVNRTRVQVLRDAMMKPKDAGGVGHAAAFNTLKTARAMFAWGARQEPPLVGGNPFDNHGLPPPPSRAQQWQDEDIDAFIAAAHALEAPNMALAIELAAYIGQRQADLLKLTDRNWREIRNLDREQFERLVSHDGPDAGKVMGFQLKQNKGSHTRKVVIAGKTLEIESAPIWFGAPLEGSMRKRIEARIAENAARNRQPGAVAVRHILLNDETGLPWRDRFAFNERFNAVMAKAIEAAIAAEDLEAAARLADLQFRDLRRTCVIRLGELGLEDQLIVAITGHKLATVKRILEVYMPRTQKMAARAVVARIGDRPPGEGKQDKEGQA